MKRTILLCIILLISNLYCGGWGNAGKYGRNTRVRRIVDWQQNILDSYEVLRGDLSSEAELELTERLARGAYLDSTFGLNGQHRRSADFLAHFIINDNTTERAWIKSGATMRWDIDGTVYNQNNFPEHTLDGDGIVTLSSTDGFSGVTHLDMSGVVGQYHFDQSVTQINLGRAFPNVNYLNLHQSDYKCAVDSILGFVNLDTLIIYGDGGAGYMQITGDGWKLNEYNITYYVGYYLYMDLCIDSLYTWTNCNYFDALRQGVLVWGDIAVAQFFSDTMVVFDVRTDSVYGDADAGIGDKLIYDLGISNYKDDAGDTLFITIDALDQTLDYTHDFAVGGYGLVLDLADLTGITPSECNIGGGTVSGDIEAFAGEYSGMRVFEIERHTDIIGEVGDLAVHTNLAVYNIHHCPGIGGATSGLAPMTSILEYNFSSCTGITIDGGRFVSDTFYWMKIDSCEFTTDEMDTLLYDVMMTCEEETRSYAKSLEFWLEGNDALGATGETYKAYLDSAFGAHSLSIDWTVDP